MQCIDHFVFVHMEVEGVIGIGRVMGVPILRLVPANDFANVFKQRFTFCNVLQCKYALAVDARSANLDPTT